jgi:protein-tyrosine phosphatase
MSAAQPDPIRRVRDVYLEFLESRRPQFAAALEAVAAADAGGVLVHCMGGKDRTGLLCALVLRINGVPAEAIADDYGQSERNLADATARWVAAAETDEERDWRLRISAGPAEAMLEVLATLDERYGGADGYLRAAGLDDRSLELLHARLHG